LGPPDTELYYNRGIAYYYYDYLDKAISDWSRVIELDPEQAQAYQKRAHAYLLKNDYAKSWADVRQLEKLGYAPDPKFLDTLKRASGRSE
jgi:tetratricopeptide (TPR) repeat protein